MPFAVKEKVEKTLRAQVTLVHKRDGDIRICGDFKLTINPVICPQVYPLPTPEEMFSTLANGESFDL